MPIYGSLAADLEVVRKGLPGFMTREAQEASNITRDEVQQRTPVGRVIDPMTLVDEGPSGELRDSVTAIIPRRTSKQVWRAGAVSYKEYASHVESGTRAHVISGNLALRFRWRGSTHVLRSVNHPGTEGVHMFLKGLLAAERRYAREANVRLQTFLPR